MGRAPLPKLDKTHQGIVTLTKLNSAALEARIAAKQQAIITRAQAPAIVVPDELSSPHPLIRDAAKRLKQREGWNDDKGLRSAPAEVLHLEVTRSALDRSLLIMDTLLKALAERSISARVDAQNKQSIVDVEGTPVSIMISEQIKRSNHEETPAEKKAREHYFHSDKSVTMGGSAPRWYRKVSDHRIRTGNDRMLRRWLADPEFDPLFLAWHNYDANCSWW